MRIMTRFSLMCWAFLWADSNHGQIEPEEALDIQFRGNCLLIHLSVLTCETTETADIGDNSRAVLCLNLWV